MKNKIVLIGVVVCILLSCTEKDIYEQDVTNITDNQPPEVSSNYNYGGENMLILIDQFSKNYTSFLVSEDGILGEIETAAIQNNWGDIPHLAGVTADAHRFLVIHGGQDFQITAVGHAGHIGAVTQRGTWRNSYEAFTGFHVGNKGFIFGQNKGSNRWFTQQIYGNGYLDPNEAANGNWNNFYKTVTPMYVNGNTYLFFQREDTYWFISRVSPEGNLTDVCDGTWNYYYPLATSVTDVLNKTTYLIGARVQKDFLGIMSLSSHIFFQKINPDGTMGPETYHEEYKLINSLCGYNNLYPSIYYSLSDIGAVGSKGYYHAVDNIDANGGAQQQYGASSDAYYIHSVAFPTSEPSNFRFEIGWDMSKTTGNPARGWSLPFTQPWTGETKLGGGAALTNIDRCDLSDVVLTGIESLGGSRGNRFYYQVGYNLDNTGKAGVWSKTFYGPYCGTLHSGGGADMADIDGNGVPDLLIMSVDAPQGADSFWYWVGWNMDANGQVASWSPLMVQTGLGHDNSGGGAALGDIDKNGRQDLILMSIDNPGGPNKFWYRIGRNLDQSGIAASWTGNIAAPFYVGDLSAGGGASLADVNGNGKPDLVLIDIDSPQGPNSFWCYIGWDIDINGNVVSWSSFTGPSLGNMTSGGGTAIGDIDKNRILDLLLMAIDNPYGND